MIIGTEEGHNELVEEVVKRLAENGLYVKPKKCKQKVNKVEFLGVVIEPEEIKMEEVKVKNILDWLTLKEVKDIQKYLGLAKYYHQFIKDFATIARPLHDMVKKDWKWEQMERQEEALKSLKEKFTKELVLAALNLDKRMRIEVDALNFAMEGVLSMEFENGK